MEQRHNSNKAQKRATTQNTTNINQTSHTLTKPKTTELHLPGTGWGDYPFGIQEDDTF